MPSSSAAPLTSSRTRDGRLVDHDADPRGDRDLVEDGGHPAAGRVAQDADPVATGVEQVGAQRGQRRGVRDQVGLDVQLDLFARQGPNSITRKKLVSDRSMRSDANDG